MIHADLQQKFLLVFVAFFCTFGGVCVGGGGGGGGLSTEITVGGEDFILIRERNTCCTQVLTDSPASAFMKAK